MSARGPSRRDLVVVAVVVVVCGLCQWGKPWHMDEPTYLAVARHILIDPLHPFAFDFNWYGRTQPMGEMNNNPPMLYYAIAAAWRLSGGGEFLTRALFLPFDLAAAGAVLAIAARFLRRPLLPVLAVILGPAWVVNMPHLMAERVMAGFALPALWLLVVAVEERDERRWRASAALAALALLSKYNAVFLLVPAVAFMLARGGTALRAAAWCAVALSGVLAFQAWSWAQGVGTVAAAWTVTAESAAGFWTSPSHKLRALLAFVGGCAPAAALWGAWSRPGRSVVVASAAVAAALFAPWFDLAPVVRPIDRATGFLAAWGVLVALWVLARAPRSRGAALWLSWAAGAAAIQWLYWSVMARFVVFILPPLVFGLAERLEEDVPEPRARGPMLGALALTAALGVAVAAVDWRYAWAQKRFAEHVAREHIAAGRRVWSVAHWGLQEYLGRAGARQIDAGSGGWDEVRPGDVVVVTRVNSNQQWPARPLRADTTTTTVDFALPLRHMSAWTGEGAFYSSVMGFLPWSLSREPVEEFTLVFPR